jgi:hypothetical protein
MRPHELAVKLSVILEDAGIVIPDRTGFQHRLTEWLIELKVWLKS